jgi:hypothetical protein
METVLIVIAICVALYFAIRLTLRYYFPPDRAQAAVSRLRGMRVAVLGRLGISVSQFRNKRRRAAYFDPGGVPFWSGPTHERVPETRA